MDPCKIANFSTRSSYGSTDYTKQHSSKLVPPPVSNEHGVEEGPWRVPREAQVGGRKKRWINFGLVGLAVGITAAAMHVGYSRSTMTSRIVADRAGDRFASTVGSDRVGSREWPMASFSLAPLEFSALNFYHIRDGKPGKDYPWLKSVKLIEPHRDTAFAVRNPRERCQYRWEVRAASNSAEVRAAWTGAKTTVVLTNLGENTIFLTELDDNGDITRWVEEVVMVKYVRREIRTLTDDEREELLDAMYQLWAVEVNGGEGKEMYGEDYADIWAMNRLHFKAATQGNCDHFHEGLGFLVSHSLITDTFEFSLQLVNPKLTVPYWDFTIETSTSSGVVYDSASPITRTQLLDPSWFGTYDTVDNMVKDGRWAYTEVPSVKHNNLSGLEPDVYGKLRSPWNMNDRPYISRGVGSMCYLNMDDISSWPTCATHYSLVTSFDSFYDWVWESMSAPHGPVHFWLGGFLDCDETYRKIGDLVGTTIADVLVRLANAHRKSTFWSGVWSCEGIASVDKKPYELLASGQCGCHGYDLTQGDDYKSLLSSFVALTGYIEDFDEDTQRQVVAALCSAVVNFGDQAQSSSSLDPMFWPIHPTMERLWQFSVLTGQVTNFHWADNDLSITLPDGTSFTEIISNYNDRCTGHHGSDIFPFGLLDADIDNFKVQTGIRGNPVGGGNVLTNREVLQALDPRGDALPYVYDTFKWEHCKRDGINFDDV